MGRYLEDLLEISWRWRHRILAGAGIGVALGIVYLLLAPSIYVVPALQIEERDSVLQHYEALRAGTTLIATQAEIFHSPSIVVATDLMPVTYRTDWSHAPAPARTTTSSENRFAKR